MRKISSFLTLFILLLSNIQGESSDNEYILGKGETLYRVSRLKKIPVETIIQLNGINDATKIREGTKILLPIVHTVKKGETLYSIAKRYDIRLEDIVKLNKLKDPGNIRIGQRIFIPVGKKNETVIGKVEKKNKPTKGKESKDKILWPVMGNIVRHSGKLVGVKIMSKPGMKIISVSSGKVIWSSPYRGFGKVVFIESKKGFIYGYLGNADITVKVGQNVTVGNEIGILKSNSRDNRASLLFIVYRNGKAFDVFKAPRG